MAEWVFLVNVQNDIEYGITAGLLEVAGIPVLRHVEGIDIIYGVPAGGIDILVPEDRKEEALQLIRSGVEQAGLTDEELESEALGAASEHAAETDPERDSDEDRAEDRDGGRDGDQGEDQDEDREGDQDEDQDGDRDRG